jgi:UDP-3-O-acyl-N-acetylglucosamine deacetylase
MEIDAEEPPILDGSSLPYVDGLKTAGILEQNQLLKTKQLAGPVFVQNNQGTITVLPSDKLKIFCFIIFFVLVVKRLVPAPAIVPITFPIVSADFDIAV